MNKKIQVIGNEILKLAPIITSELSAGFNSLRLNVVTKNTKTGAQDITTKLDHKIGQLFIEKIYKKFKNELKVDSEEKAERIGKGEITLRIDPVDGSKHASIGLPLIACSASLIYKDEVKFGMIIEPFSKGVFHAFSGSGAFLNSRKIKVNTKSIKNDFSFIMYEAPNSKTYLTSKTKFDHFKNQLANLQANTYRMRNIGLFTLSICYVACGASSLFVDFSGTTKLYDVEAAYLIAKEAGAVIGTTDGQKINNLDYNAESEKKEIKGNLLIGNPKAWEEVSNLLNK